MSDAPNHAPVARPASGGSFGFQLRKWAGRVLLRSFVNLHALAIGCLDAVRRRRPAVRDERPKTVLLTGTFYSENWIMNHLRPLAGSKNCERIWIVCAYPIPPTPKIEQVPPPRWLGRIVGATPARLLLFSWLALRRRPDVVGGFHLLVNGLLAAVVARLVGARSVYFCGGGPREVEGGGFVCGNRLFHLLQAPDAVLERKLIKAVNAFDLVVTMGRRAVQFFREHGVSARFEVVPGGIDARRFAQNGVTKIYDLILVAHFTPVKRIDLFLETVRDLAARLPEVRAVIVGTGELEAFYRDLAGKSGVAGRVTFAGFQRDVVPWLNQSKIFVLTSDSEGLSLSLMEAMMCGLPCVVSDVGELGELVEDGVNGCLVRERTPSAFARALQPLLAEAGRWSECSRAARAAARQIDLEPMAQRWDNILATL